MAAFFEQIFLTINSIKTYKLVINIDNQIIYW